MSVNFAFAVGLYMYRRDNGVATKKSGVMDDTL